MFEFKDLVSASVALLGEAVTLLSELEIAHVIIGGWSPFFLNVGPITHPGTRDVDVLFEDAEEPGRLKEVVRHFLSNGYTLSAKHPFQLLKVLSVLGEAFVFNVDLLHPREAEKNPALFVDHLELPVPLSEYRHDLFVVMSMAIPQSAFIFDGHIVKYHHGITMAGGAFVVADLPLVDEIGLIVTKCGSVNLPKRRRDAFDIFLAIDQARDYSAVVEGFKRLKREDRAIFNTLYEIRRCLDNNKFGQRVVGFLPETLQSYGGADDRERAWRVDQKVEKFLSDVNLDPKAMSS